MQLRAGTVADCEKLAKKITGDPYLKIKNLSDPDAFLTVFHQFDHLERAVIDTSSLIYLKKINLLWKTVQTIGLITVSGVKDEFGSSDIFTHIEIIELNEIKTNVDRQIMRTAANLRLPVISEDKKILMAAANSGLPFFNTLMIMNFLIYKKEIDHQGYNTALQLLRKKAYYEGFIFDFGRAVYEKIMEKDEKN
jgi:hypothetical protein